MPPKGKKGKKGKKMPVLIDGVDTSAMTRDQLEAFAVRLKAEMDREREERNYFQLERDKIRTFWEITRQQLDETRYELQQKDKDIEATQDLSDIDKKHVMQQMKHLQFENHNKLGEVRAEAMTQLKLAQEHHVLQETELQKDKRQLRRILRERMEVGEMQLRQMETHFNEKLLWGAATNLRAGAQGQRDVARREDDGAKVQAGSVLQHPDVRGGGAQESADQEPAGPSRRRLQRHEELLQRHHTQQSGPHWQHEGAAGAAAQTDRTQRPHRRGHGTGE
ncbi:dynein regulatory complex subunit 4 isoform X2 [Drosophila guanche]|uniref:dynein regulatory complex subunit 4 isoform X2 n=1 Tax=Drosophila guanche TaxID=7266 RepID=UPI001470E8F7|nr:dynein regulatory complex subunit 4 isoform X2 [Drosophila guanche]